MATNNNKGGWVAWFMRTYRITFLLVGIMFVMGIIGFDNMAKAEFPDIVVRQGVVGIVYPGATAEEVEMQVARPLERYLFTYSEVNRKKTTTTSSNGSCVCLVELNDEVNNKDEVWSKIKHGLNTLRQQSLPKGVAAMVVNDDFGSASALLIAIESDMRSRRDLRHYADDLSDELRRISAVSKVNIYGDIREQLSINIDQQRLSAYGVTKQHIIQALSSAGMTQAAGSLSGEEQDVPLHVKPAISSEQDIEGIIVYSHPQGGVVHLRDVAEVKREYDTSSSYIEYNAHPCILLSVEMAQGKNIVHMGKDVQAVLDEFTANRLPKDITISRIADQCQVVEKSVTDFLINLLESMAVIIVVMLLLFPWRTALVAGVIVPLSTFISIAVMSAVGIPLHIITLAGLILVLGMVVDNAIVVLDGYLEYLGKGMDRWDAAVQSVAHYFMPMTLATLCISVIYFPFLFIMKGALFDIMEYLPWTIFINLMVSLLLAVVVLPIVMYLFIKTVPQKSEKKSCTDYVQLYYERVLTWAFRRPWWTIVGTLAFILICVIICKPHIRMRMMPMADRNQFAVEITLPAGTGLAETRAVADSVRSALSKEQEVKSITAFIGSSSPRFHASYAPKTAGRNTAQFIVNTTSPKATEMLVDKYEPLMSEIFPNAFVKFKQLDYQNFNPFEYRFYGDDEDSLRSVADALMAEMRRDPNLMNVHTDWQQSRPFIDIEMDPVTSSQLGFSRQMTETQLAVSTGSLNVSGVWENDYEVPLVLRDPSVPALDAEGVGSLHFSSAYGSQVILRQVADVHPEWGATNIVHRGGKRCITVTCDIKRGVYSQGMHAQLQQIVSDKIKLPKGVTFEVGGEPEDDATKVGYMGTAMGISILIVFFFVLFNFRRYKMALACLAAIVLIIPGTVIGLALMNRYIPLTLTYGIVALIGMLMRNEILIFEHADDMRAQGMSVRDAAYDAGSRRMVPIFLTTATTAVGVIPMILAQSSFWMPVGVAIFSGGIVALVLTVIVLPVVYWKLNDKKTK